MIHWPAKVMFFIAALAATLRAVTRLIFYRRQPFDRLVEDMRQVPGFKLSWLQNPHYLAAGVDCLAPWLPPWSYGRCLKRSLLLLDLWSRCGLRPTLHLGMISSPQHQTENTDQPNLEDQPHHPGRQDRQARQQRNFHVWLTTDPGGPSTPANGHQEIWHG